MLFSGIPHLPNLLLRMSHVECRNGDDDDDRDYDESQEAPPERAVHVRALPDYVYFLQNYFADYVLCRIYPDSRKSNSFPKQKIEYK